MWFRNLCPLLIALVCLSSSNAAEPTEKKEWGNLTATFRYDGEPPTPKPLVVDKDLGAFKDPILDPSLIVDPKTRGIANVVVWLYLAPKQEPPPIYGSYKDQAEEEVLTETRGGIITPHITLLWTTQKLVIKNSDSVGHDRKMNLFRNTLGCDLLVANATYSRQLPNREAAPVEMSCNIHPWERGFILVRDNPYMAVSDREGKLVIKNLPLGKHTFSFWHESIGFLQKAKRNDDTLQLFEKGRLTVEIKSSDNVVGEFHLNSKE